MRIAVFGTGGVGGYFGGRLAQAGEDVTFIARGIHLEAIKDRGLWVESINGNFHVDLTMAFDNPEKVGAVDVVLVATKAWQVPEAAQQMKPLVGSETVVVPLENGVSAPDELAAALGREHVLGGLCRISAFIGGPGLIKHVGVQPYIAFGELGGEKSERVERLYEAFSRCQGLKVEVLADIEAAMWDKFVFIAAASGVGAVTRQPMGVYRSVPESRALLLAALEETTALARARGVHLPDDEAQKTLAFIDSSAPGIMASMQKDIMEGRPSELEAQNGTVVRMGRELGVPTPTHEFIYASLLPGELINRQSSIENRKS
jgi:2-dehydropantoate 2-reductase